MAVASGRERCRAPYTLAMLTPEDASRVASEFDLGDEAELAGPVARGELGQIWRLGTSRGSFAVKEWFDEIPRGELLEGARFQEAAGATGVPCPSVHRRPDGSPFADVAGDTVAAYGWIDVRERDPSIDPEKVGALVGALHRVPFEGDEPPDPWYSQPVGRDRWDELVRELTQRGAPFAEGLRAIRDELLALEDLIEAPSSLRTCHRDLWADNLRATADGSLCLIDWDNAGRADPSGELALILFEFARGHAGRARALHSAYREADGPGRVSRPGDFTMPIAQLAHIGERQCALWLTAATDEARDRAGAGAREFVDEPLTREVIRDLLDAIG